MSKVTRIFLEDELHNRLDELAASMGRSKEWLIEQAIRSFVVEHSWKVAAIREALEEYNSGKVELKRHEQVMERLEAKIRARTNQVGRFGSGQPS